MSKKQKQGFVYGALILSLSGFLCKLIGAVFRIPLTVLVGPAPMSYYSSAYSVYNLLLSLATAGIPTGIAALISRSIALNKLKDTRSIVKIASKIFISIGFILSVLGMIFAKPIAVMMNSEEAYSSVFWIMPAIFFIAVVSVFKGFFQGYNNMVPTAISNVIESVVKLLMGYGIAVYLHMNGYAADQVVGGAIFGVTLGTFLAMVFMLVRYFFRDKNYRVPLKAFIADVPTEKSILTKNLMVTALPIMVSSVTSNLMSTIDAFVVMNRLKTYMPIEDAKLMWGAYGNMSLTIFNLPSFLIIAIGISLVPSISAAFALKDMRKIKRTINKALKYSSILAFASAFGLNAISGRSIMLLFSRTEGVDVATSLLEILSFALIAVGLTNVTSSILQSVGKSYLAVISVGVGAAVKTISTFLLLSFPQVNIFGAPIATNIAYPVMLFLNLYFIHKYLHIIPNIRKVFIRPLIAGIGCFVATKAFLYVFDMFLPQKVSVFPAVILAAIVYIALLFILKLITIKEIRQTFLRKKKSS